MTGRDAISAQDIGFFGVATDKDSDEGSRGVASDSATNFGDVGGDEGGDEVTDRGDEGDDEAGGVGGEAIDSEACKEGETTAFGFFA